jgi:hypothetical protein
VADAPDTALEDSMIRQLRARHYRMVIVLAVLLPLLLIAAVAARKNFPVRPIPPALLHQSGQ